MEVRLGLIADPDKPPRPRRSWQSIIATKLVTPLESHGRGHSIYWSGNTAQHLLPNRISEILQFALPVAENAGGPRVEEGSLRCESSSCHFYGFHSCS